MFMAHDAICIDCGNAGRTSLFLYFEAHSFITMMPSRMNLFQLRVRFFLQMKRLLCEILQKRLSGCVEFG